MYMFIYGLGKTRLRHYECLVRLALSQRRLVDLGRVKWVGMSP